MIHDKYALIKDTVHTVPNKSHQDLLFNTFDYHSPSLFF